MIRIAALQLGISGIINSVFCEEPEFWDELLLKKDNNLLSLYDQNISDQLNTFVLDVSESSFPITTTFKLNNYSIKYTGLQLAEEKLLINCEATPIEQPNASSSADTFKVFLLQEQAWKRFTKYLPHVVFELYIYPDNRFEIGFTNKELQVFSSNFNKAEVNKNNDSLFIGVHPEDVDKLRESIYQINQSNYWDIEYRIIEDGKVRWIKGFGKVDEKEDSVHKILIAYLEDVTINKNRQERLRLMDYSFMSATTAIHFVQKDGSSFEFNEALCELLGYTRDEFQSLNIFDINPEITESDWKQRWEGLSNVGSRKLISKLKKKDGSIIDVEITSEWITFEGVELNSAFIVDITEKKKLEESLKLVDFAFRSTPTPMHFIKENGQVIDCNYAACNLLGYTKEEYVELKVFDIDPELTPESYNTRWNLLRQGSYKVRNARIVNKDKKVFDVEILSNKIKYGNAELMCTSFIDITEKKKLENRLRLVDFSFRNVTTAILLIEEDGTIYDFNDATLDLLGFSKREIEELDVFSIDPYATIEVRRAFWNKLRNENKITHYRTFKKKDGSSIELEIVANKISFEGRELNFAFLNDITEKKKKEKQLKIVDHAFRNASIPLHFLRRDGSIYDFNDSACELFGYTREEYENITLFDISLRRTPENWKVRWEQLKEGNIDVSVAKFKKKDGSLVDVEVRTTIIEFEDEELSFTSFNDITERTKYQEALLKSNERYENAMIATSDVIWEADLIEDTFYLSSNYTLVFGHPVNGIEKFSDNNRSRLKNIHPDDFKYLIEVRNKLIDGNEDKWEFEFKFKKADDTYADVLDKGFCIRDENGNVVRFVGAMRDITIQKAEENRLRLLESVVLNTNETVIITEAEPFDLPGPKILYVNETFTKMTGYSTEEAIGQTPRFLQSGKTDRKVLDELHKSLQNWKETEATVCNKRKNGEEFWVNLRITPVANKDGFFTHWVSIQRDVTEEMNAKKEKESLLRELVHNIEELKQFGFITTHNLRSPLTNLVSICRLIDDRKIEDEMTRKLIGAFRNSTTQLNDTLNDLIKILFIKERKNLEMIDLSFENILDEVTHSINYLIEDNKVIIDADFSLVPTVKFSQAYLVSVFYNLLTNSIKYAHPDRRPIIRIWSEKMDEGKIKLLFSDNGLGMDMSKVKSRLFGLYQRFHDHPNSKGLGLYLIQSQINALRGTIEVESEENVGTTFIITFKNRE